MKHFLIRSFTALTIFVIANLVSLFVRSDDLFTPDTPDAMTRFGFPILVAQDGGPVAFCFFSRAALFGNVAIALLASFAIATWYPAIRNDIRRTLGFQKGVSFQSHEDAG